MAMTKWMSKITLTVALISFFAASMCLAEDANAPAAKPIPTVTTMRGTVGVVKDANGITAVNLTTDDKVVHNFVLDSESKALAKYDGKAVSASVMKKDGQLWVVSFKPADKSSSKPTTKPAPKPAPKPKPKP